VGAFVVVLGIYLVGSASAGLAGIAAVFNILIPFWIVPGFGVVLVAIARVVATEKGAR